MQGDPGHKRILTYPVTTSPVDGGELSVEEMYKRTLQEVGSLREQLGQSVVACESTLVYSV